MVEEPDHVWLDQHWCVCMVNAAMAGDQAPTHLTQFSLKIISTNWFYQPCLPYICCDLFNSGKAIHGMQWRQASKQLLLPGCDLTSQSLCNSFGRAFPKALNGWSFGGGGDRWCCSLFHYIRPTAFIPHSIILASSINSPSRQGHLPASLLPNSVVLTFGLVLPGCGLLLSPHHIPIPIVTMCVCEALCFLLKLLIETVGQDVNDMAVGGWWAWWPYLTRAFPNHYLHSVFYDRWCGFSTCPIINGVFFPF